MSSVFSGGNCAGRPGKKGVRPEVVAMIQRLLLAGVSVRVVADAAQVSERQVRYYRAGGGDVLAGGDAGGGFLAGGEGA